MSDSCDPATPHPDRIGAYRVIDVLGVGGTGTVYLAEQDHPVCRRVALKVIHPQRDSQRALARFELERQALAVLEYPNFARVLDSGVTPQGQLFFAMDLVSGERVTSYCDQQRLETRQRLELFKDICLAVHHAHQKGIVHRDIKPSNVLVQTEDGRPVPVIIDFGVAKAITEPRDGHAVTEHGQIVGTREYMSPEQAAKGGHAIDVRGDVYALGVLLYELLTGTLPIDPEELHRGGPLAFTRVIRDKKPDVPSSRVTTTGERTRTRASELRGDLDWITMQALEKSPERRYQSAGEFAADIQRYLDRRPVLAGPPGALYRIGQFARRHRARVLAGSIVVGSLAIGTIATLVSAVLAGQQAEVAAREEELARKKTAEASHHLARYELLRYRVRLDDAMADAKEPPRPPWPASVPALSEWLDEQGAPLRAALPVVRDALAELRAGALPWTREQQQRDRETHPAAVELSGWRREQDGLRGELAKLDSTPGDSPAERRRIERQLAECAEAIARLEARVAERRTYETANDEDQFLERTLAELERDLGAFTDPETGTLGWVERRLAWASKLRELSIDAHRERWERAIAAIEAADGVVASVLYAKAPPRDLTPQVGLVPIGMNPKSGLWEFYHLRSAEDPTVIPEHDPETGRIVMTGESGIVFVLLPGGKFWMGAQDTDPMDPNYDAAAQIREGPIRVVSMPAFFLARHEITQGQWSRLTGGSNPSGYSAGEWTSAGTVTVAHPIESVSWSTCDQILRLGGLLIPTETEWEYGCRAGTRTPYSTGEDAMSLKGAANALDESTRPFLRAGVRVMPFTDGHVLHAPVGSFAANRFGLHDMHGNIEEWCRDAGDSYVRRRASGDGRPTNSGNGILRGGSFESNGTLRSGAWTAQPRDHESRRVGVRAARRIESDSE